MIGSTRITKKEFYTLGGFSNPALFRKQTPGGGWSYWRKEFDTATKLSYQEGLEDGYQGKPGRAINLVYVVGWKQGRLDKLWDSRKGGSAQ